MNSSEKSLIRFETMIIIFVQLIAFFTFAQSLPNFHFPKAEVRGEEFIRPFGASKFHDVSAFDSIAASGDCVVEQVHITVGDEEGSVIVSFVTNILNHPSRVFCGQNADQVLAGTDAMVFDGSSEAYSSLVSVNSNLYSPAMGAPGGTVAEVMQMENTSVWAFDPVTHQHYSNYAYYKPGASVTTGLQAYNNPKAIYDSPIIHTVVLTGLESKMLYFYRPLGSCIVFNFTAPFRYAHPSDVAATANPSPFPQYIALTADLGQTEVSAVSTRIIGNSGADFAILVGDLSYADGWPKRWDTFGRFMQPTFSNIPLLTVGGNHEVGI